MVIVKKIHQMVSWNLLVCWNFLVRWNLLVCWNLMENQMALDKQ
jgi:hypothetical protein